MKEPHPCPPNFYTLLSLWLSFCGCTLKRKIFSLGGSSLSLRSSLLLSRLTIVIIHLLEFTYLKLLSQCRQLKPNLDARSRISYLVLLWRSFGILSIGLVSGIDATFDSRLRQSLWLKLRRLTSLLHLRSKQLNGGHRQLYPPKLRLRRYWLRSRYAK